LVYGSNKPAPDTLIDVDQLTQFSNFTVKFDGSKYKSFDLKSMSVGLMADLPGGAVNIPFIGNVRWFAYDADGQPLKDAGITKQFVPEIDPTTGKTKMNQMDFGPAFANVTTLRITLLNVRIPGAANTGKITNLAVAIVCDTVKLVPYPK
jgi:hypothetical protein